MDCARGRAPRRARAAQAWRRARPWLAPVARKVGTWLAAQVVGPERVDQLRRAVLAGRAAHDLDLDAASDDPVAQPVGKCDPDRLAGPHLRELDIAALVAAAGEAQAGVAGQRLIGADRQ